jgi:hypothetical protein
VALPNQQDDARGLAGGIVMVLIVTAFLFFRTPVGRQVLGV